jgi:hypothetical protein
VDAGRPAHDRRRRPAVGEDLHVRASLSNANLRLDDRLTAQVSVTVSTGAVRQVRAARTTSG